MWNDLSHILIDNRKNVVYLDKSIKKGNIFFSSTVNPDTGERVNWLMLKIFNDSGESDIKILS